jgi:hypothetical protein
MSSLEFKLLLPLLSNLSLSIYLFIILVIMQIGFVSCLVSLFNSSSGDWYISTLAFVKGWNVVALAFSPIRGNARGGIIGGEIVSEVARRGIIINY